MDTQDPRVGSARDNSSSPGLSRIASNTNSSSVSSLLATLIPVGVWTVVCVIVFIVLRRKCHRVYAPRTILESLESQYALFSSSCDNGSMYHLTDNETAKGPLRSLRGGSTGTCHSTVYQIPLCSTIPLWMATFSYASFECWASFVSLEYYFFGLSSFHFTSQEGLATKDWTL